MELQLLMRIVRLIEEVCNPRAASAWVFSDAMILKVWFWAVIHDRPVSWATQKCNWPIHLQKLRLPSNATMSRRLKSFSVREALRAIERRTSMPSGQGSLIWFVDGKPLVIGGCSKDRQAGYGRAANSMAKGYKLHGIVGKCGEIAAWRVAPMHVDERVMCRRMLRDTKLSGYIVADSNYDSNKLHGLCDNLGNRQLVAPRRYGPKHSTGHRRQTPGRLRSKAILEQSRSGFGQQLMAQRGDIERVYGNLTSWGGGLTHLPPWVRTHRRVHRWVQAKLILNALKRKAS